MSLLVCVISGAGVPQKCRLQKLVKNSRFVQMAKFFGRSYFNKVKFQIRKYKILDYGHFKAETRFVNIGDLSYCDCLGALSYYYRYYYYLNNSLLISV